MNNYLLATKIEFNKKHYFMIHLTIITGLVLIVYWEYIIGNKNYVFNDIASDSYTQILPRLMYLANEIQSGKLGLRWNFRSSIGDAESAIIPRLDNWVAFCGKQNVIYLLGISQILKVWGAGIIFFLYLKKLKISNLTCSIFSVFYAFNTNLIIRGSWNSYPNEAFLFALWLYSFECWFNQKQKWLILLFNTCIFYINFSAYEVVLFTGIFLVYMFFRFMVSDEKLSYNEILNKVINLLYILLCSLILTYICWGDSLIKMICSDRFSNGANAFHWSNLRESLTDFKTISTAFFRTIGTDILGINDFSGTTNFLEAPAFYCGIFSVTIFPIALLNKKGTKKTGYIIAVIGVVLYIFITPIRYLANGLSGNGYKISSLWIIVVVLFISAYEFDKICNDRQNLNIKIIVLTNFSIYIFSIVAIIEELDIKKLIISFMFINTYLCILFFLKYTMFSINIIKFILLCIATIEVIFMSYDCINSRGTMAENGYEDGTPQAIEFINKLEGENFYRIDKFYESASFCDALYQNYYGTKAYKGGTGDRKNTGDFYNTVSMPIALGNNHVMLGFNSSTKVNTLMSVKYLLSKKEMNTNYGYEFTDKINNIYIYKNKYALPVGYVYYDYIDLDEYYDLDVETRRNILLKSCVMENISENITKSSVSETEQLDLQSFEIDSNQKNQNGVIKDENGIISIGFDGNPTGYVNIICVTANSTNNFQSSLAYSCPKGTQNLYYGVIAGIQDYYLEFNDTGTNFVQLYGTDKYEIEDIKVYQIPQQIYYKDYINLCNNLNNNSLDVEISNDNFIKGHIQVNADGILAFSIPFDNNWHIYIDNAEQPIQKVNIGMLGSFISDGSHEIILQYEPESYYYISIIIGAFLIFAKIGITIIKKNKSLHSQIG